MIFFKLNTTTNMKKLSFNFVCSLIALFLVNDAIGQIRTPSPSVGAKTTVTVGLTEVSIEYARPSAKGRKVFAADGLVPFGKVWRTGANSATKITFADDVKIGGQDLKKGAYAILSIPEADKWAVHFYPYTSASWPTYEKETPTLIAQAKVMKLNNTVETFTIDINNIKMEGADIVFSWENTAAHVSFAVEVDKKVMANIEQVMAGPSQADYYAAAAYYHAAGKDLNKALEYVNKATTGDSPKYWQIRLKALILGDLGKKEEAIKAAQQSLELAKEAGNDDYVKMNEASIKEWTAKKK